MTLTRCAALLLCTLPLVAFAETKPQRIQVFLGTLELEDQSADWNEVFAQPLDVDFSSLPTVGIEVEFARSETGTAIEWGINTGGGISWKNDDIRFVGSVDDDDGQLRIEIDNSFLLAEVHLGGYLRAHLGKRADFYLGAGPSIMYSRHSVEDEDTEEVGLQTTIIIENDSSSDVTFGYYVRAGLEFQLGNGHLVGFGVRYLGGELDFDDTIGKLDIEGPQVLLTYSTSF